MTLSERFWAKVAPEPNTGCWLWTGACSSGGYGHMGVRGKTQSAHRISYEMHKGLIPEGLDIDHLCRVRCCVNPDHLEPVTRQVNTQRGDHTAKTRRALAVTHCPKGHPYSGKNLRWGEGNNRKCRICQNEIVARWRAKNPDYGKTYMKAWCARQKEKLQAQGL